jgi:subtilase family serine protease
MPLKKTWVIFVIILLTAVYAHAQSNQSRPLITQAVDESKLTVLKGNTHPLARAEFDRGEAPADLPMNRMMLILKRSPEQETALEQLLVEQTDKTSPNFHKWLTPVQFGQQFGPSDTDIQTITSWLESHGFQIGSVAKGRNVIEFSGNAAQVKEAFHTTIHKYLVNGKEHWANASDPEIPSALAPAIDGVASLHNFLSKPLYHLKGAATKSKATGEVKLTNPLLTLPSTCNNLGAGCYILAPYDFATIYNVLPLWNAASSIDGSGQSIAVVGRTDVNISDMQNFRSFVGLPAKDPFIIVNGADPGTNEGDEGESDLDLQWAGAVGRNADIYFVTSASTNAGDGVNLSAQYIVDNNLSPILSYSYGLCEADMGISGYDFSNSLWQQGAAEGITILVATGDTGSSICEDPQPIPPATQPQDEPATTGLAVNGVAATSYNVAVGGTDFDDWNTWSSFWSSTNNNMNLESALSYIPETTYNDSCTNFVFGEIGTFSTNAETNCNNTASLSDYIVPFGGGGGKSTFNLTKPTWQTGLGVPNDGARDLPDVSMFAGDGTIVGSAYVVCQADSFGGTCVSANGEVPFNLVGGTSASAQVFAGIISLVDQKAGGRVGNIDQAGMYTLAATPPASSCNSSGSPSSSCIFYDVTLGTIAMPCVKNSPNCNTTNGADANGILSGFSAGVGYDQATGLGSVNAANFVNAALWAPNVSNAADFTFTGASPTVTVTSQGGQGTLSMTVTSVNNYSGTFNLSPSLCSALPSEASCSFSVASVSVSPATPTATFTLTIATTAPSMLTPGIKTKTPRVWPGTVPLALAGLLLAIGFLTLSPRGNQRRWSTALALVAFGLLISVSACGGGGNNGGGGGGCGDGGVCTGGTPEGTTSGSVTLTDGAATPTIHSVVFTLTVN